MEKLDKLCLKRHKCPRVPARPRPSTGVTLRTGATPALRVKNLWCLPERVVATRNLKVPGFLKDRVHLNRALEGLPRP